MDAHAKKVGRTEVMDGNCVLGGGGGGRSINMRA